MPDKLVDLSEKVTIPRVLFIYGSPRRGGNTDILTDRLAEGAESKGALVERLIVTKHTIRSCTGCEGCSKKGTCVLDDAMQGLYPLIERAHRMVVGSPVYFYGVTAQLKALVDRCQVYWRGNIFSMSPLDESWMAWREKVMWSLWPHLRETGYSRGVVLTLKALFDALNFQYGESMLLRGLDAKGAVLRQPRLLEEAYELGCRVAEEE